MRCDDAETDPRVDHGACLAMGIRSIIAAPIHSGSQVTGLIEIFSDRPRAFNRNGRILLQRLAEIVAANDPHPFGISAQPDLASPSVADPRNAPLFEMGLNEVQLDDSNPIMLKSPRAAFR